MNVFSPAQSCAQFSALQDAGTCLDSATTAFKSEVAVETIRQFYSLSTRNVHRNQFAGAQCLTARYEAARERVVQLLNTSSDKNIAWTRGTTEPIDIVAQCYVRPCLQPGDEIIASVAKHHANLVPWLMVAQQTGAKVVKLPLNAQRLLGVDLLPELITPRGRILTLCQMSNVTSDRLDPAKAVTFAYSVGMVVMVDGAQGAVHFPADVQQLNIDFYVLSGHELYGPTDIGVLYGKSELLEAMSPRLGGSKVVHEVSFEGFTTQSTLWRLEAGTPNITGVIRLSTALGWLTDYSINQAKSWDRSLATLAGEALAKHPGFCSFRCQDFSLLVFDFTGIHHSGMAALLAEYSIALRAGQYCTQPLLTKLGIIGTLRASFTPYNAKSDVDMLMNAVDCVLGLLVDWWQARNSPDICSAQP